MLHQSLNKNVASALFIAHPGHELRIHHWLEIAKPITFIFTDGSGHTAKPRLAWSESILENLGINKGFVFGKWSDKEIYAIMLKQDIVPLADVCRQIAKFLLESEIKFVAGDAIEGYNSAHDLCRYTLNAAVQLAEQESNEKILNFDFTLAENPNHFHEDLHDKRVVIKLDEAAFKRKLIATKNYLPLEGEMRSAFAEFGQDAFATEYLRPVNTQQLIENLTVEPPFYETYGEKQVAAKHYQNVIRFREHIQPLVKKLWQELKIKM